MMKELLTEKYRPKTLAEIALPQRIKDILNNGIQSNVLLYGTQGTGKTSTAKLMVKQFGHSYIYINCSKETGIDTIRDRISKFCMSSSLTFGNNNIKVVIMDEMDGMSAQAYQALRGCIEEFACNSRFVATCNFLSKVPEPIQSRFTCISFDFDNSELLEVKKQYAKRILYICENENVKIEKEAISALIKHNFPDMRSIVNKIQSMIIQNVDCITANCVMKANSNCTELFDLLINHNDPVENYRLLISEYSNKVDDVLNSLGKEFIEYIIESHNELVRFIPHITICVAKYQSQKNNCIDPVICMLACVYEIQQTINQKL